MHLQEIGPIVWRIEIEGDPRRVMRRGAQPETPRFFEMLGQAAITEREPELWSPPRQSQQEGIGALATTIGAEHDGSSWATRARISSGAINARSANSETIADAP
jgi:hypothetical protein